MANIILYTTHCPKCKVLESKLNSKNIEYEICDDTRVMIDLGFQQSPILRVDSVFYDFVDAIKWVNAQKGEVM